MRSKYLVPLSLLPLLTLSPTAPAYSADGRPPLQLASMLDGISNLFDRKRAHLQELIDQQHYEDAQTFYITNKEALDQSRDIGAVLGRLSDKLNEHYTAGADDLIHLLNGLQAPVPAASWPAAGAGLQQAQVLLDKYNQLPLLKEQAYRSPKVAQLTDAMTHASTTLQDGAADAFAAYDHSAADFFDKYPQPLATEKKQAMVAAHEDRWLPLIATLGQDRAQILIKAYAPYLREDKDLAALGASYYRALAGWNGWKDPLGIEQVWSLGGRFQAAGLDPRYIPVKRAVVVLTGAAPGPIPAGWDADESALGIPYLIASGAELASTIAQLDAADIHYIVIVDPSRIVRINTLAAPVAATGSRTTGTQQLANPDYTRAKQAVDDAATDYNAAVQAKAATSNQVPSGGGSALGSIGSAVMGAVASSSASNTVEEAQARLTAARTALSALPATITQNVTEPYTYMASAAEHVTVQQVGVYFLDTRNSVVYRAKTEGVLTDTDTVYSQVDARDPEKSADDDKSRLALQKFRQPAGVAVKSASELLPDILSNPIAGSRREAADLAQIISDDQAIFQHKSAERLLEAEAASKKAAEQIGVDIGPGAAASDTMGVLLFPPVPEDIGCAELSSVRGSSQLPELWNAALDKVTKRSGDAVQSSYVFMEARDDISNLREEVARDAEADDVGKGVGDALVALKTAAAAVDSLLDMAFDPMTRKSYAGIDDYFSERMKIGAYNMVAAQAREVRPDVVASLYLLYHQAYNSRYSVAAGNRAAYFAAIDSGLDKLGKQLYGDDSQLAQMLNTVAGSKAAEELNNTIDARCGLKPAPAVSTAALIVATPAPAPAVSTITLAPVAAPVAASPSPVLVPSASPPSAAVAVATPPVSAAPPVASAPAVVAPVAAAPAAPAPEQAKVGP